MSELNLIELLFWIRWLIDRDRRQLHALTQSNFDLALEIYLKTYMNNANTLIITLIMSIGSIIACLLH